MLTARNDGGGQATGDGAAEVMALMVVRCDDPGGGRGEGLTLIAPAVCPFLDLSARGVAATVDRVVAAVRA
jgi:hypothetical protein